MHRPTRSLFKGKFVRAKNIAVSLFHSLNRTQQFNISLLTIRNKFVKFAKNNSRWINYQLVQSGIVMAWYTASVAAAVCGLLRRWLSSDYWRKAHTLTSATRRQSPLSLWSTALQSAAKQNSIYNPHYIGFQCAHFLFECAKTARWSC